MTAETPLAVRAARLVAWLLMPAGLAGAIVVEIRIVAAGHAYPESIQSWSTAPFVVMILACWLVGVVLTLRVPGNVVGWLFLGLATSIMTAGFLDTYAEYALRAAPGRAPYGELAAVLGDTSFAWWFMFVALCLQLTPSGRPMTSRWAPVLWVTVASAVIFQLGALLRSTPLEGVNAGVVSPLAPSSLAGPMAGLAAAAVIILGLCLLASVYAIFARFRRSRGEERQQMLWLVIGVAPLPLCVVVAYLASYLNVDDDDALAGWLVALGIVALAIGAGFAIAKYRLYGVEEIVSRAVAYVLATAAVILAYGAVVLVVTRSIPGVESGSTATTILATLAAAGVALPAYRWGQDRIDRRFNRRRYDAVHLVRVGLEAPSPDLAELMTQALGDPSARILFPVADGEWVTPDGRPTSLSDHGVDVVRRDAIAARVEFDPGRSDRGIVEAVAQEAAAEIDNLGLLAELSRQLQQVRDSRARLAGAHLEERQRMERDLHDGAQQRLLAIAMQLQSARMNGSTGILLDQTTHAIEQLGIAVQELRDLAHGLQPPSLASGGLRAAVDDLVSRIPLRLTLDIDDRRFPPTVEGAAWFVIAEAVSNAVKYANADEVHIRSTVEPFGLRVVVTDEGVGGADARGRGLQGLADRVAALGGELRVAERLPHGTQVEAVFPCVS